MLMRTTTAPMAPSGRARQNSKTARRQPPRSATSGISPSAAGLTAIIEPGAGTRAVATPAPRRDHAFRSFPPAIRAVALPEADPWVEPGVRQVNQEVDENEDERDQHHQRLGERVDLGGRRIIKKKTEPVQVKDLLGDDDHGQERREVQLDRCYLHADGVSVRVGLTYEVGLWLIG